MEPFFLGQVCLFAGNFAPAGWAFCQGQLLSISENEPLFSLIGTTYGGDGETTFGLPDLRGRIPVGAGTGAGLSPVSLGQKGGQATQTLTLAEMPQHTHTAAAAAGAATATGDTGNPGGAVPATAANSRYAAAAVANGNLGGISANTDLSGGNQAFNKHMPGLGIHYIIALFGIMPD